jgi:hypothetical protein
VQASKRLFVDPGRTYAFWLRRADTGSVRALAGNHLQTSAPRARPLGKELEVNNDDTLARALHDVGLAGWFGGSLMGAVGLNGASAVVENPKERGRVASAGWARWTPVNLAAIGAYVIGGTILTATNRRRVVAQSGVAQTSWLKTGITALALGATAYSRYLGQKVMQSGDVPVADGTTPLEQTPEEVARAQRQLKLLQWAIPAHVAALIVLSSKMGEQQKPHSVVRGVADRVLPSAA